MIEINIEIGMPIVDEAMLQLKEAIKCYGKNQCLVVIHGYGSSGKGGVILQKIRQCLNAQVCNRNIKQCIYGEDFSIFNSNAREISTRYSGLENLKDASNHEITVKEI